MPRAAIVSPSNWPLEGRSPEQFVASPVAGFRRKQRLTESTQFEATLGRRALVRSGLFAIHGLLNERSDFAWRLGLVVPKRYEALAVRRNLVKRVWREAFRKYRRHLETLGPGHDLVVRLLAKPRAPRISEFKRLCRQDADALLVELFLKLDQRPPPPCALP